MTTRSDRTTGANRAYKGSGPIGRLPVKKPGNPAKPRRKTKPFAKGRRNGPHYHAKIERGRRKVNALIARAFQPKTRMSRVAAAVKGALQMGYRT